MTEVPILCPHCSSFAFVDESKDAEICVVCGEAYSVAKAAQLFREKNKPVANQSQDAERIPKTGASSHQTNTGGGNPSKSSKKASSRKTRRKSRKVGLFVTLLVATLLVVAGAAYAVHYYSSVRLAKQQKEAYLLAVSQMEAGDYLEALLWFEANPDYLDSADRLRYCRFRLNTSIAILMLRSGYYEEAHDYMINGDADEIANEVISIALQKYASRDVNQLANLLQNCYSVLDSETAKRWARNIAMLGKWEIAEPILSQIQLDVLRKNGIQYGDHFKLGFYEQDTAIVDGKEEIEWIVIHTIGNKALAISKDVLDYQRYDYVDSYSYVPWENCTLRKWLNDTFLNDAFDANQKKLICPVSLRASEERMFFTDDAQATSDRVFLLSFREAFEFFSTKFTRRCSPTFFAEQLGLAAYNGHCRWWLRTTEDNPTRVPWVNQYGDVEYQSSNSIWSGVRPAIWIDLDADLFKS